MLQLFSLIGFLCVSYILANVLRAIYIHFLRTPKDLRTYGSWAIVTGATDGIGKAMAEELARKGMNILLISRSPEKLNKVCEEIRKSCKVQVKTLTIDFDRIEEPVMHDNLRNMIEEIKDVGLLVNNVGMGYAFPQYLYEIPMETLLSLFRVNIFSAVVLIRLVLPGMRDRNRGVILNITSASARLCVPLLSAYSATKRCIEQLTECIAYENQDKNVQVQCHNPMFVATKLAKIRNASFFVPTPTKYAKAAVRQIGYGTMLSPFWPHALHHYFLERIPQGVMAKFSFDAFRAARKQALAKLKKKET